MGETINIDIQLKLNVIYYIKGMVIKKIMNMDIQLKSNAIYKTLCINRQ